MKKRVLVVGVYAFPEAYPPTLNAIIELSKQFDHIYVLSRNITRERWIFPDNVTVKNTGKEIGIRESERKGFFWKVYSFIQFTFAMLSLCFCRRPRVILLYDIIPLFSFTIIKKFLFGRIIFWYHNHDVADISVQRRFSIGWFAKQNEQRNLHKIDIFSLPAIERLQYFPINDFKGKFFFLPNFPSLRQYNKSKASLPELNKINLIYQGTISEGHGLENIIETLSIPINGKKLELHLAGPISLYYRAKLNDLALLNNCEKQIIFHGKLPYNKLPELTIQCDIGIAINIPSDVIYQTGGTASNKIYEYAACGIPILYYNSEHYNKYLKDFDWAFATELSSESITQSIEQILNNYYEISKSARKSFEMDLNFETSFAKVTSYLSEHFD